jgi:hypothetical protein
MEIIANAVQLVNANQNVYFTDTVACGGCSIIHRDNSGLVTIRGATTQCRARYRVTFTGNVAVPTGGTAGAITFAIAVDGEAIPYSTMIETVAAVEEYSNLGTTIFIDVPKGCYYTISVKNIGTASANIQNANLLIERVA